MLLHGNVITRNHGAYFPGFPSTATGFGGGIAVSGTVTLMQNNRIVNNRGTNAEEVGAGGGIYGFRGTLHIVHNTIAENRATPGDWGFGGGVNLEDARATVDANTILSNTAAAGVHGRGGGVRIEACPAFNLTNNIVAHNEASEFGSGIRIASASSGQVDHNTLAENQTGDGVGVHVGASCDVVMYSNIIISHTTGIINADAAGSTVGAKYTLFEANGADYGAGVSSSFEVAGPAALLADYHLDSSSGAIDEAPALSWVTRDIDGGTRPVGVASDVGADEFAYCTYLPLVLRDSS